MLTGIIKPASIFFEYIGFNMAEFEKVCEAVCDPN
jgi:hypothetical protein